MKRDNSGSSFYSKDENNEERNSKNTSKSPEKLQKERGDDYRSCSFGTTKVNTSYAYNSTCLTGQLLFPKLKLLIEGNEWDDKKEFSLNHSAFFFLTSPNSPQTRLRSPQNENVKLEAKFKTAGNLS